MTVFRASFNRAGRLLKLPRRRGKIPRAEVPALFLDALKQPHLLIAGATGSGKSVVINGLVYALLHRPARDESGGALLILVDPKRVELSAYRRTPHCIRYASEPETMLQALQAAMQLCEDRYRAMQLAGVKKYPGADCYVIIDELADLMTTQKRDVLPLLQRLAQIGRAARVHLIAATQTPIAKVMPTELKCNFDARIGLRTRSAQDSRNIIGRRGLELLPRYGQAYFMAPEGEALYKVPMIPDEAIDEIIAFWT